MELVNLGREQGYDSAGNMTEVCSGAGKLIWVIFIAKSEYV